MTGFNQEEVARKADLRLTDLLQSIAKTAVALQVHTEFLSQTPLGRQEIDTLQGLDENLSSLLDWCEEE